MQEKGKVLPNHSRMYLRGKGHVEGQIKGGAIKDVKEQWNSSDSGLTTSTKAA